MKLWEHTYRVDSTACTRSPNRHYRAFSLRRRRNRCGALLLLLCQLGSYVSGFLLPCDFSGIYLNARRLQCIRLNFFITNSCINWLFRRYQSLFVNSGSDSGIGWSGFSCNRCRYIHATLTSSWLRGWLNGFRSCICWLIWGRLRYDLFECVFYKLVLGDAFGVGSQKRSYFIRGLADYIVCHPLTAWLRHGLVNHLVCR